MKKNILWVFVLLAYILLLNIAHAQRSIGKVEDVTEKVNTYVIDIKLNQWIGKKFIILEQPKSLQNGYTSLSVNRKTFRQTNPEYQTRTGWLRYDKFVGHILTVIDIEDKYSSRPRIVFMDDQLGIKIYGKAYFDSITEIAFLDNMDEAKKRWIGKTVYSKKRYIRTYDELSDKYGKVKIKIATPLKVTDIWWGFSSGWPQFGEKGGPLWIIVETPNEDKGFVPTSFSWTNIYKDRLREGRPWDDDFTEFNPKDKYKWSDEVLELIDKGKVRLGMNKEDVDFSLGRPKKINKDISQGSVQEQWIYDSQYLYFNNGKLESMQSR